MGTALMVAAERSAVQRAAGGYHTDRAEGRVSASESQNRPDPAAPLQRLVRRRFLLTTGYVVIHYSKSSNAI
jgi:hypothetical protein